MTKRNVYKTGIFILLILQFYFFDLIPGLNHIMADLNSEFSKKLQLIFFVLLWLVRFIPTKDRTPIDLVPGRFVLINLFLLTWYFFVAFMSDNFYNQTLFQSFSSNYSFVLIIGYFALRPFFSDGQNFEWFYNALRNMTVIYLIIQAFQGIYYRISGQLFLSYTDETIVNIHNMGRFTEATEIITFVGVLIAMKPFLFKRNWIFSDYTAITLIIFFHAYMSLGRMYLLIVLGSLAISYFLQMKKTTLFPVVSVVMVALGTIGAIILIQKLNFFGAGNRQVSMTNRLVEIGYFSNKIFEHGLIGIGFPDPTLYSNILKGTPGLDMNAGYLSLNDIGILGTISVLGVGGIIYFAFVWLKFFGLFFKKTGGKFAVLIGLFYLTMSYLTLSPTDMGRMLPFIILLLSVDYAVTLTEKGI